MKKFKFTVNGKEYEVEVKNYEGENAEVIVDGTQYNVTVQREEEATPTFVAPKRQAPKPAAAPKQEAAPAASAPADGYKSLAPLPGTVMQIYVNVGAHADNSEGAGVPRGL